jgi:hypothetical protein
MFIAEQDRGIKTDIRMTRATDVRQLIGRRVPIEFIDLFFMPPVLTSKNDFILFLPPMLSTPDVLE